MLPTTTIRAYFQAIEDALRAHFGDRIRQYGAYEPWDPVSDEPEPEIKTPMMLIELESIDPDDSSSSKPGRVSIRCSWSVHVVLSIETERLQIALAELAAAVVALIRKTEFAPGIPPLNGNRWGLGKAVDVSEAVSASPAGESAGANGRDSWVVTWEQVAHLPESLLTD